MANLKRDGNFYPFPAQYNATPATRTDGDGVQPETDSKGNLKTVDISNMIQVKYDYVGVTWTGGTFTEVFVFKTGGASGTLVATVTIVYTDATKNQLSTITLS